uniref:Uncharacterized protein n=1 Tax=Catagonus wagneri TaxID=51154 RepID=A0A8C3VPK6_9CETA
MNPEKDFAPLTPNIVRALNDKLYEKRKVAFPPSVKWLSYYLAAWVFQGANEMMRVKHAAHYLACSIHPAFKREKQVVLGEFLKEIKKNPSSVKFAEMANILVIHCQTTDDLIQLTAMCWMREFIQLAGRVMLPYSSGILTAVLPCLAYDDRKKSIKEVANVCNQSLMKLVTPEDDEPDEPKPVVQRQAEPNPEDSLAKQEGTASGGPDSSCDSSFSSSIGVFSPAGSERAPVTLHLDGIVQVLNCHLSDMAIGMMTRIAVLKWLYHLYIKTPRKMFRHTDSLFPILLQTLSDESDEVILKDLEVLAEIASSPAGQTDDAGPLDGPDPRVGHSELQVPTPGRASLLSTPGTKGLECSPSTPTMNSYFYKFMINLLKRFSSERKLLEVRGAFIIRLASCAFSSPTAFSFLAQWSKQPLSRPLHPPSLPDL